MKNYIDHLAGKQVVLAFSDTAGGNLCMAMAYILTVKYHASCKIFTNNLHYPSNDWPQPVVICDHAIPEYLAGADWLFTGTSHPETSRGFELTFHQLAREKNIVSIAYIDHWTHMRLRLEGKHGLVLPTEIWVTDAVAKEQCIAEGLPEDQIHVRPNPYRDYLANYWTSRYQLGGYAAALGLDPDQKIIVIAPDPVSLRGMSEVFGFTEAEALQDILRVLASDNCAHQIVLKIHPLQDRNLIMQAVAPFQNKLMIHLIEKADNPELIDLAALVIGFYSSFLLDADAMKKPTIRYFPGHQHTDPLRHLPHIRVIRNPEHLLTLTGLTQSL